MSYGQVFETISDAPQETDVLELLRTGAEVARINAHKHGLTCAPKSGTVIRMIPNRITCYGRAQCSLALNLAQAEVRLAALAIGI